MSRIFELPQTLGMYHACLILIYAKVFKTFLMSKRYSFVEIYADLRDLRNNTALIWVVVNRR